MVWLRFWALALALAAPTRASTNTTTSGNPSQLLISGSGYIYSASFDGRAAVKLENRLHQTGAPSWLLQGNKKGEGNAFIANDENANTVYAYSFDSSSTSTSRAGNASSAITLEQTYTTGSAGVVHLAYNVEQTRMFGAAYGSQTIDVWDTSPADGSMTFLKTLPTNNASSKPHQTIVSPAGNIALVNDLGLDQIHVLDLTDDAAIAIATSVPVPTGCGPRHGAFYRAQHAASPSRYLLACELSHQVLVFNMTVDGALDPTPLQDPVQTALDVSGSDLTAAELVAYVNHDSSADLYVSNRGTGGKTDSIAHFRMQAPTDTARTQPGELLALTAEDLVSTGGLGPRMMSLSADGSYLFVGNQHAGPAGLTVLSRSASNGKLATKPLATVPFSDFAAAEDFGPQFVAEWGRK